MIPGDCHVGPLGLLAMTPIFENRKQIFHRQKMVEFSFCLCYNGHINSSTQDSYIGNTTASQAVKAGSTPVSCSKGKHHSTEWCFYLAPAEKGVEPALMRQSSRLLLVDVIRSFIFQRKMETDSRILGLLQNRKSAQKPSQSHFVRQLSPRESQEAVSCTIPASPLGEVAREV